MSENKQPLEWKLPNEVNFFFYLFFKTKQSINSLHRFFDYKD